VLYDYGTPEYIAEVEARNAVVANLRLEQQAELDALVRDYRIDYVFIGAKGGSLKPDMFWGRPEFEAVYDHDGVQIFKVRKPSPPVQQTLLGGRRPAKVAVSRYPIADRIPICPAAFHKKG
jgi:hypothetical protein